MMESDIFLVIGMEATVGSSTIIIGTVGATVISITTEAIITTGTIITSVD